MSNLGSWRLCLRPTGNFLVPFTSKKSRLIPNSKKIVHKPMPIGPVTKAVDLITPGNWVDFFRFVSEPYHGLVMPEFDVRDQVGTMMPKIMELGMEKFQEEYDLIPHPDHVACEVGEWSLEDVNLPDGPAPYYLRANKGPRWMLGGVMSRPFATTKQSAGSFAISNIESSSVYGPSLLARKLSFPNVHHCFVVFEGILGVSVDGYKEACVTPGETCFVGANQPFSISFKSKFVRFWSFASGDGIEALIHEAGKQYQGQILPDTAYDVDEGIFSKCCKQLHVRERGE